MESIQGICHYNKYPQYDDLFSSSKEAIPSTVLPLVNYYIQEVYGKDSTIYIPTDIREAIVRMFMNMYYTNIFWTSALYSLIKRKTYLDNKFSAEIPSTQKKIFMIIGHFGLETINTLFTKGRMVIFNYTMTNGDTMAGCDSDPSSPALAVSHGVMLFKDNINFNNLLEEKKRYNRDFIDNLKSKYNITTMYLEYNHGTPTIYYNKQSCDLLYDYDEDQWLDRHGLLPEDDLSCIIYGLDTKYLGVYFKRNNKQLIRPSSSNKKIYEKISLKDVKSIAFFVYITEPFINYDEPNRFNAGIFDTPLSESEILFQHVYTEDKYQRILRKDKKSKEKKGKN